VSGHRVHILGASGTGCSTLGRALADHLGSQAFDVDDFYWRPSDPPFADKRPIRERLALMEEMFLPRSDWILSGSCSGWGDVIVPRLTHVLFLTMPAGMRLARLRRRERRRFGSAIEPGGHRAEAFRSFLDWAMSYDDPVFTGRSRHLHEAWLAELDCPVTRLDAAEPLERLTAQALAALDPAPAGA